MVTSPSSVTSRTDAADVVGALNGGIPREFHYLRLSYNSSATSTTRARSKFARQLSAMSIIYYCIVTIIFVHSALIQFLFFFFNLKRGRIICSPKRKRRDFQDTVYITVNQARYNAFPIERDPLMRSHKANFFSVGKVYWVAMETRQRLARFMSLIARSNRVARCDVKFIGPISMGKFSSMALFSRRP